jgi:hypothetical protein
MNPSLNSINLLQKLTSSGKRFTYIYLYVIKDLTKDSDKSLDGRDA